jgi:hypothetical protein
MAKLKSTETIYVRLLDEGVDVWRPVSAETLGEGRYRIVSENTDPEDEKCEKGSVHEFRNLSCIWVEIRR